MLPDDHRSYERWSFLFCSRQLLVYKPEVFLYKLTSLQALECANSIEVDKEPI